MIKYLLYLIFIISVAFAAGSIILSSRLRTRTKSSVFSSLLYFQVFIFTFGFYGIWGQAFIKSILSPFISEELLLKFADISLLLGLPFLVFAWLMFLVFSFDISGRRVNNWFSLWFLLLNFSALIAMGYFITRKDSIYHPILMEYYFIILNLVFSFCAAFIIHFPGKGHSLIHDRDRRVIAPVIFIIMIAQCTPLIFYFSSSSAWPGVLFIFTFFAGNSFLPVYLTYGVSQPPPGTGQVPDYSFKEFCLKYEVSSRESDIIREICNGLSNKEISDKLFISLQTVKDHTHRIYIKTNVRSRVQLINLVKGNIISGQDPGVNWT